MVVSVVAKYMQAYRQFGLRAALTKMYTVRDGSCTYVNNGAGGAVQQTGVMYRQRPCRKRVGMHTHDGTCLRTSLSLPWCFCCITGHSVALHCGGHCWWSSPCLAVCLCCRRRDDSRSPRSLACHHAPIESVCLSIKRQRVSIAATCSFVVVDCDYIPESLQR